MMSKTSRAQEASVSNSCSKTRSNQSQIQHVMLIAIVIGVVVVAGFTSLLITTTIIAIITSTIFIIVIPLPHLPVLPHALPR